MRFLTPSLSIVLDLVRFGAAFLVLVGHAVQLRLWGGAFPFGVTMQHNCVVVFFVLSGLVIATSVLDRRKNLASYVAARMSRILPVAIPAVLFSTLCAYGLAGSGAVPFDNSPDALAPLACQIVLPALFLSVRPEFAGPVWNPPYWSLTYEVWYYALFAAAWYLRGWRRWSALALGGFLAGPNALLLAPVWLAGVALVHVPALRRVSVRLAPGVLLISLLLAWRVLDVDIAWKLALRRHMLHGLSWSEWALSDTALALCTAGALTALRPLAGLAAPALARIERPARLLAGFSFTLYLFHWPLIELARSWGLGELHNPLAFATALATICMLCWAISLVTEHQSPRLRRWIAARINPEPKRQDAGLTT